jgi:hypothetical protein
MNIYAKEGDKVVYAYPENGYKPEQEKAAKMLELGKTYTVQATDVDSWATQVYLKEFTNVAFNSVLFEDLDEYESLVSEILAESHKEQNHAIAFANWIHKYADKYMDKWGLYGTDKPIRTTEELYELFVNTQT